MLPVLGGMVSTDVDRGCDGVVAVAGIDGATSLRGVKSAASRL